MDRIDYMWMMKNIIDDMLTVTLDWAWGKGYNEAYNEGYTDGHKDGMKEAATTITE